MRLPSGAALLLLLFQSTAALTFKTLNADQMRDSYRELAPLVKGFAQRGARSANTYVIEAALDEPTARKETASLIRRVGDGTLCVACDRADILGMAVLRPGEPQTLDVIAVATKARDRGVGKKLLAQVTKLAARAGGGDLQLEVEKFNESGLRFFERNGFVQTGRRKDLRVLTKALAKPLGPRAVAMFALLPAIVAAGAGGWVLQ